MHTFGLPQSASSRSAAQGLDRRAFLDTLAALNGAAVATSRSSFVAETVGPDAKMLKSMSEKAVDFLRTNQSDDGSWTTKNQPGVTAMVCMGLESAGVKGDDPVLRKGLKYLLSFSQKDGGVYRPENNHKNYETSLTLLALAGANSGQRRTEYSLPCHKTRQHCRLERTAAIAVDSEKLRGSSHRFGST